MMRKEVMDRGFPRKIHMDWPGIVGNVDAAFELNGNGLYLYQCSLENIFSWNYMHVFFSTGHVHLCRSKAFIFSYQKRRLLHIMNTNAWFGC